MLRGVDITPRVGLQTLKKDDLVWTGISLRNTLYDKHCLTKVVLLSKLSSYATFHAQGRRHDFFRGAYQPSKIDFYSAYFGNKIRHSHYAFLSIFSLL